ncbi:hypothetical protein [Hyphomicrobium sp.]|uniref:hypothetical protein n=1 Tax=Hyphomicrobium sp. TaxID=82 RepID=UPI0025C5575B|nr:hypothetical protein [Hyphomicrobium sp.]MCC7253966.1 hypothetical protein [Hyphomicrobium sp.]
MLTTLQLVICGFVAFVVFPLALRSLFTGSKPPEGSLRKYYAAESYLNFTGDLMLVALSLLAITSLAQHFGVIDTDLGMRLSDWITVPFMILLLAYLVLWVRAMLKVRRSDTRA